MSDIPALPLALLADDLLGHLVASLRLGAFLIAAPLFGARWVPLPVRIQTAMVLALPVAALAPLSAVSGMGAGTALIVVLSELALGLAAGLILSILFGAAVMAGDRIANALGLGFAAQVDPASGGQSPVIAQFLSLVLLAVFVTTDGHLAALRMIYDSYRLIPPGASFEIAALIDSGIAAGGTMAASASRLMMPVVATLLLINLLVGVLTRSAPQLNLFSFGFPLTLIAGLSLLLITAPGTVEALSDLVALALQTVSDMLAEAANGRG